MNKTGFIKQALVIMLLLAAAFYISHVIVHTPKDIKYLIFLPFVFFALIGKPELVFYLGIILIFNGFGILNMNFSVAGMFKTHDIGLLACLIAGMVIFRQKFNGQFSIFKSPISTMTVVFICFILFEILLTSLRQGQSLKMSLQMGRRYFPILLYYSSIPLLLFSDKWHKYIKWIVVITIVGALFYVLNFNPRAAAGRVYSNMVGGYEVERRFGAFITGPLFVVAGGVFAYLLSNVVAGKKRVMMWGTVAIMTLQPIMSFGRGYMIAFFTQLGIVLLNSKIEGYKKVKLIIISISLLAIALTVVSLVQYSNTGRLAQLFIARLNSARTDFVNNSGTYNVRQKIIADRMKLVKEFPVFGAGLIHHDGKLYPELEGIISTGHSGYISLLAPLGIGGFLVFVMYTLIIYLTAIKVIKMNVPFFYRAIALATAGYMIQGYPRMVSTASFFGFKSLSQMAILAAILQVCIIKDRNGYFNNDTEAD